MVSSDGFSIDTTAPVPDPSVFFYMDTANGEAKPVTKLMASNSTIQVAYGCNDNESSVVVSICCPPCRLSPVFQCICITIIMVIFNCLFLKALSSLQYHEGGGYQNNYTNVSLRLYIIIHRYIDAQSHLLLTLSLLSSLSLSSTHTPHTILTPRKSGRYELIRFLEVEEVGFWSRLEGVDSCSISNVQWQ